jgi:signal transduction histidine kinase
MLRVFSALIGGGARRIAIAGAVLIAITIAGAALSVWDLRRNAIEASRQNMSNLGIVLAEQLSRSIQAVDLVLGETVQHVARSAAATPGEFRQQIASETSHAFLVNRMHALPQASALFLSDAFGALVNSSNYWPVPTISINDRDFFRAAQEPDATGLIISPPTRSRTTGRWTIFLTRRLESRAGVFLGTAQAAVELRYFEEFYKTITLLDGASVTILSRDGMIFVRYPLIEQAIGTFLPKESPWYGRVAAGGGTFHSPGYVDGIAREIAVNPLKDYPLAVTVTIPEYTALEAWRQQAAFIGIGTTCAVIVFAILFRTLAVQFGRLERSKQALSRALVKAEHADRAKSDFLGRMSHELRTPLNAIIGFSETMTVELFGPLGSARYLEYAQDIHRSGVFLHDLISDVLDMVKIEAGHRALHPEPFDFPAEIEETLRMVRPRAASGDVTIGLEVLDPPELLVTDRRAFKQIVLNLIGNAVKFTLPGGTVTVRLSSSGEDALLQVIDTGIGISAANLVKLGTPFFRIEDNPHQAGIEGTGLGVALTKSLIEVCGWSLTYDSELGCGTTVTVTMPGGGRTLVAPSSAPAREAESVA